MFLSISRVAAFFRWNFVRLFFSRRFGVAGLFFILGGFFFARLGEKFQSTASSGLGITLQLPSIAEVETLVGELVDPTIAREVAKLSQLVPESFLWLHFFTLFTIPVLLVLLSAGMCCHDRQRGSLRYVLSRLRKSEYLAGLYLSHAAFFSLVVCVAYLGVWFSEGKTALTLMSYAIELFLLVSYVCIMTAIALFVSVFTRSPAAASLRLQLLFLWFVFVLFAQPVLSPFRWEVLLGLFLPHLSLLSVALPLVILWVLLPLSASWLGIRWMRA